MTDRKTLPSPRVRQTGRLRQSGLEAPTHPGLTPGFQGPTWFGPDPPVCAQRVLKTGVGDLWTKPMALSRVLFLSNLFCWRQGNG